ncbi:hypothetical protein WJ972_09780 [Achromobacter insuavis]
MAAPVPDSNASTFVMIPPSSQGPGIVRQTLFDTGAGKHEVTRRIVLVPIERFATAVSKQQPLAARLDSRQQHLLLTAGGIKASLKRAQGFADHRVTGRVEPRGGAGHRRPILMLSLQRQALQTLFLDVRVQALLRRRQRQARLFQPIRIQRLERRQ